MTQKLCPQLKIKFQELKSLKSELDLELQNIQQTKETKLSFQIQEQMEGIIKEIKEVVFIDEEKIFQALERFQKEGIKERFIATTKEEINKTTRAYLGEWNIEVFQKIRNFPKIKHLYESYPNREIFMQTLETDPRMNSPQKAQEILEKEKGILISGYAEDLLLNTKFSKEKKEYALVRFSIAQLGLKDSNMDEIYQKAQQFGLKLCPAEVGPHLRFQNDSSDRMIIAMDKIVDTFGDSRVFSLRWSEGSLELKGIIVKPDKSWHWSEEFIFLF